MISRDDLFGNKKSGGASTTMLVQSDLICCFVADSVAESYNNVSSF